MKNLPKKEGYYFARTESCKWYNLVVYAGGEEGFFDVEVWNRIDDTLSTCKSEIYSFGPEIKMPDVPKGDFENEED